MVVDIIILMVLAFGFVIGFKRGFTKQLVSLLGIVLVLIFSFILKNPISTFMYNHLPFMSFGGLTSLNVLFYEVISFFLVFSVLTLILKILLMLTKVFETVLNFTIILGIPSKILGGLLGIIENYIIVFIALYFMSLPMFNLNFNDSKLTSIILNKTPILSDVCDNTLKVFEDITKLKEDLKIENIDELNAKALKIMIKYNVISEDGVNSLVKKGKLKG